jgi:hypothetical protein
LTSIDLTDTEKPFGRDRVSVSWEINGEKMGYDIHKDRLLEAVFEYFY